MIKPLASKVILNTFGNLKLFQSMSQITVILFVGTVDSLKSAVYAVTVIKTKSGKQNSEPSSWDHQTVSNKTVLAS